MEGRLISVREADTEGVDKSRGRDPCAAGLPKAWIRIPRSSRFLSGDIFIISKLVHKVRFTYHFFVSHYLKFAQFYIGLTCYLTSFLN